jgi:hypothetical protein
MKQTLHCRFCILEMTYTFIQNKDNLQYKIFWYFYSRFLKLRFPSFTLPFLVAHNLILEVVAFIIEITVRIM